MYNKRIIGNEKEKYAAEYLKKEGYLILESNYYCRMGEIDLIALDNDYLVFIEVKYRKNLQTGYPEEAVCYSKKKKIINVAKYYMLKNKISFDIPIRFDVVTIIQNDIRVIKNAFETGY